VDTKLDELLAALHREFTAPPLAPNPYPRLVHLIRVHAAKMELCLVQGPEPSALELIAALACGLGSSP
jgi:hypothetical protein